MKVRRRNIFIVTATAFALFLVVRSIALIPVVQNSLGREMARNASGGNITGVVFWLFVGAAPNRPVHGCTPAIHAAAEQNRVSVLKLLLAVGADPNLKTKFEITPLWCAENMKAREAAAILVRAGGYSYISPNAP